MLDMQTQFGKMVITDDGSTFADEELKKEIEDNIEGEQVPEISAMNTIKIPMEPISYNNK